MKTNNEDVMEKDMILFKMNLLNRESLRIYLDAENLSDNTDFDMGQLEKELKRFRESLFAVRRAILHMVHGSEREALVFLQVKGEVLSNLHRIHSNLEGVEGILNPKSRMYN